MRLAVTAWADMTTKQIPACGGSFQPYGTIELAHINSMISELALDVLTGRQQTSFHRVWIGRRTLLERASGKWNPKWIETYGDPGDGGYLVDATITRDQNCPECSDKT